MFHVPERYRLTRITARMYGFRSARLTDASFGNNGMFFIQASRKNRGLVIIASDDGAEGNRWEHVSVRAVSNKGGDAIPNWEEMCIVKELFWDTEDACVQYHPRESEYVTANRFVLHIWRPRDTTLPEPPYWMVGNKPGQTREEAEAEAEVALGLAK